MKILDELERLARVEPQTYADLEDWAGEVSRALPALIRVARAAERWSQAEEFFADKWNTELEGEAAGELAEAEVRLEEALQQLRELGEHLETHSASSQGTEDQDDE